MATEYIKKYLGVDLINRVMFIVFCGWRLFGRRRFILINFFIFKVAVDIFADFADCLEIRYKAKNNHLAAELVCADSCLVFLVLDPVQVECIYEFRD